MTRRVRILPERLLPKRCCHPEPPLGAPPRPDELVSLLVVGDPEAGKTSLVQSFVHHESISTTSSKKKKNPTNTAWSVGYYKKDILFANRHHCLRSLRVQLWDTSGIMDSTRSHHRSPPSIERASDFNVFWNKASIVLLVVSLADPFDQMIATIKRWRAWLKAQQHQQQQKENHHQQKEIVLLLHQGDQLLSSSSQQRHPADWMELGGRIADLCRTLNIQSWHITSSCLEQDEHGIGNSIDTAFRHILGNRGKPFCMTHKPLSSSALSDSSGTATTANHTRHDKDDVLMMTPDGAIHKGTMTKRGVGVAGVVPVSPLT